MDKYALLYDDTVLDVNKAYHIIENIADKFDLNRKFYYYLRNVSEATALEIIDAMNKKERGE